MLRRIGLIALLIAMPGLAKADTVEEWRKQMAIRLNSNKGFTPMTPGQSGTVKVGFVIDRTGKLVSNWLAESTGIPALDERALAIVDRSQPFPVPPPELDDERLSLIVPFVFSARPAPGTYHTLEQENAAVNAKMRSICRGC
jgi:protein TonB